MKFLAILRDSLRETIDTKVFYVMVALSGLLTLFAFGISFTPGRPEDAMKAIANLSLKAEVSGLSAQQRAVFNQIMQSFNVRAYEVTRLEALDDASYPPDGRYRFVLHRREMPPGMQLPDTPAQFRERVQRQFGR